MAALHPLESMDWYKIRSLERPGPLVKQVMLAAGGRGAGAPWVGLARAPDGETPKWWGDLHWWAASHIRFEGNACGAKRAAMAHCGWSRVIRLISGTSCRL